MFLINFIGLTINYYSSIRRTSYITISQRASQQTGALFFGKTGRQNTKNVAANLFPFRSSVFDKDIPLIILGYVIMSVIRQIDDSLVNIFDGQTTARNTGGGMSA